MNSHTDSQTSTNDQPTNALKEKTKTIGELLFKAGTRDTKLRYHIGTQVLDAMTDDDKYGKSAVKYIAEQVGCTAANLYAHADVADAWSSAEFDELAVRKNSKSEGLPLSFTHFIIIAQVEDSGLRPKLIADALEEGDSVRELRKRIDALKSAEEAPAAVRALRPKDALRRLVSSSNSLVEKAESDIETLGTVKDVTPELVEQVETARKSYAKARELIEQLDERCTALLTKGAAEKTAA
jgi:hypothetical protein